MWERPIGEFHMWPVKDGWSMLTFDLSPPHPQVYITPYRAVGLTSTASNQTIALCCRKDSVQHSLTSGGQANAADAVNSEFPPSFPAAISRKTKAAGWLSGHDSMGLYIEGALWLSRPRVSNSRRTHLSWLGSAPAANYKPTRPSSHRNPHIQPTPAESGKKIQHRHREQFSPRCQLRGEGQKWRWELDVIGELVFCSGMEESFFSS